MPMYKDYTKISKEDLIKYINELKSQLKSEKYGLYWDKNIEREKEVEKCIDNIPVLSRNEKYSFTNYQGENNLLIEGDNFDSLLSLNLIDTPDGLFDLIYIDPPYNTGNKDFVYNDKFVDKEDGYRHSKWLNFMHIRLVQARQLMKSNALIFISIDGREFAQLKLLCDQVFGENMFIGCFNWMKTATAPNLSNFIRNKIESVLHKR